MEKKMCILVYRCDILLSPSKENEHLVLETLAFLSICGFSMWMFFCYRVGALLFRYRIFSDIWWFSAVGSALSVARAVVCLGTRFLFTVAPVMSMVKEWCVGCGQGVPELVCWLWERSFLLVVAYHQGLWALSVIQALPLLGSVLQRWMDRWRQTHTSLWFICGGGDH